MEDDKEKRPGAPFDVVIVGAGVSGTALLYALARYGKFARIALVEKYENVGGVNSHARINSQTLHVGDIETNYSMEKVRELEPAASMVARYALALSKEKSEKIIFPVQKMILAVGGKEAQALADRYEKLKEIFPKIQKLDRAGIERDEPEIVHTGEAVVIQPLMEVEVEALPDNLPEKIEVDITTLRAIDDAILVSSLKVPEGVTVVTDPEAVVVKLDNAVTEEMKKLMEEQAAEQAAAAAAPPAGGEAAAEGEAPAEGEITEGEAAEGNGPEESKGEAEKKPAEEKSRQ